MVTVLETSVGEKVNLLFAVAVPVWSISKLSTRALFPAFVIFIKLAVNWTLTFFVGAVPPVEMMHLAGCAVTSIMAQPPTVLVPAFGVTVSEPLTHVAKRPKRKFCEQVMRTCPMAAEG